MKRDYRKAQDMLLDAAALYGIRLEWLTGGRRTKTVSQFRQMMVRRFRQETDLSWREIGLLLGFKDRAALSGKRKLT